MSARAPETAVRSSALGSAFDADPFDLLARMTLLLVILYNNSYSGEPGSSGGEFSLFMLTVGVLGLVFPRLIRSERYWFVVAASEAVWIVMHYRSMDDHKYLLAYWLMAIWLAVKAPDTERNQILSWNARILLGLTMAWAALWKGVLSDEYLDSAFFHMTLLTDFRFEHIVALTGALDMASLAENQNAIAAMEQSVNNGLPIREFTLISSAGVEWLAYLVSYSTLILEAGLAIVLLVPSRSNAMTWLGHIGLIAFLVTTYLAVPVIGFGWLLIIMGLAFCPPDFRRLRWTYVVLFFALQLRIYLI